MQTIKANHYEIFFNENRITSYNVCYTTLLRNTSSKQFMTITYSLDEIEKVAKELLAIPSLKKVITFHAGMGAGKTTLIKAMVKELGVSDNSSSPTFSLVNEYEDRNGDPVYHFDLYRLNSEEEAYDMGIV